jgi:CHAT domain-containing protein
MGGLARALGRLPSLGVRAQLARTYDCFEQAVAALDANEHPRLWRDLQQRWGEVAHEISDFDTSLRCYRNAAETSQSLLGAFDDPEHQAAELEQTRGYALFAAYAAARLGRHDEAARLAELQRGRATADLFDAASALAGAPPELREAVGAALARIQRLEDALRQLQRRDPEGEMAALRARLADHAGVDPALLQMRRTDTTADASSPVAAERDNLRGQLTEAKRSLRSLLARGDGSPAVGRAGALTVEDIKRIVMAAGFPLVYMIATTHGGVAVIVGPDGVCAALPLGQMTSDLSRALLYGGGQAPGFVRGAMQGDADALRDALDPLLDTLRRTAVEPLAAWLRERGHARAALIPMGSLGALPLHAADGGDVAWSYAPSARALGAAVAARSRPTGAQRLLAVANPRRTDERPLPFTVAEARALARLEGPDVDVRVLTAGAAVLAVVREQVKGATQVHLGCHGLFRPSEPLESHLLLTGEDRLTLGEVFFGGVDIAAAQLVVLSACQSGNAEFRRGPDEALGFPAALVLAGVPSVVSTMWPVDDAATALFMTRFHELRLREGQALAVALQHASAWLRNAPASELQQHLASLRDALQPEDREADVAISALSHHLAFGDPDAKPYASPEYWAAFILTGL